MSTDARLNPTPPELSAPDPRPDPAPAPVATQRAPKAARGKAPARPKKPGWPPPGGSLDEIAGLLEEGIKGLPDGEHSVDYRRSFAVRTMMHGLFERAAAAIDGEAGWSGWPEPWFAALARGETVMTALARRVADAPALTPEQMATLRRWLVEGEGLMAKPARWTPCRPRATIGAGWILLGEPARGEPLLAAAIDGIDPEATPTENRRTVAEALVAVGRVREAIEHLTSGEHSPSSTQTPGPIAEICACATLEELQHLMQRMRERDAHNEISLLTRGLDRLIALRAWDAAVSWTPGFDGLSARGQQIRLAAAMVAAGEPGRAEASLAEHLEPSHATCAEFLLGLARVLPERARTYIGPILAAAPRLLRSTPYGREFLRNLAGAAALLGPLEVTAQVEGLASDPAGALEVQLGVLATLDPAHPEWGPRFARARTSAQGSREDGLRLAALAYRGGQPEASELLTAAIEATRGERYADVYLLDVMEAMTAVGDFAGAHRAWTAISRGRRSQRNDPLLAVCEQRGLWAAALEILRQMPKDLNGYPQRASKLLLTAAGKEGW